MDRHSHLGINLGIKYCARSPPGVVLGQGINMNLDVCNGNQTFS
jgi:hypothetical protein